jgi:hypothetical protein
MRATKFEKALGLRRTKAGSGDKETAYVVQKTAFQIFGAVLIAISLLCVLVMLHLSSSEQVAHAGRFSLATQALRLKKALVHSRMHKIDEEQAQESKLVKVLSLLQVRRQ